MDRKTFAPQYYSKFACIGGACRNNCCAQAWNIFLDKATYEKYKTLEDEELRENILSNIHLISEEPFKARIYTGDDHKCVLLDERGFCTLQLKLGPEYLCDTCRLYPRVVNMVGDDLEKFLEMSCEPVVELALFNHDYMNFSELPEVIKHNEEIKYHKHLESHKYTAARNGEHAFWKLRVASIAIMQSRQFRVRLRMLILCLFIQEVDNLLTTERDEEVPLLSDTYMQRLDMNYFDDFRKEMPNGGASDPSVMLSILKEMQISASDKIAEYIDKCLDGFGIDPSNLSIPDSFSDYYIKYYNQFLADKEYVFENYIVNNILVEGFPFNYRGNGSVAENYTKLMAKHDTLEFLLVGLCRHYMRFNKRNVVECISLFTRSYDHHMKGYLGTIQNS